MRLKHLLGFDTLRGLIRFYTLLLVSLPLLLAALFFTFFQRGQVIEAEREQLAESLAQDRNIVRSWMSERFADVEFLARLGQAHTGDRSGLDGAFRDYMKTHRSVSAVAYVTADGWTAVDTGADTGVYLGDRDYFKAAKAGRPALVTGLIGRTSGKAICIFSAPVTDADGKFGGLVFIPVRLDVLDAWLREARADPSSGVILCDGEGRILAPTAAARADGDTGMSRVPPHLLAAGDTGFLFTDPAGREMIGAVVSLGLEGWRLVQAEPVSEVLAGYRRQALWVVLGTLAAIVLATPLVLRLCRNLERPLEILTGYARSLRSKGYDTTCPPDLGGPMPREIAELFEAFCAMAGEVRGHIEETERLSVLDALTGLYNRRFLFSGGAKLLDASARAGRPCTCLMLDVDHFKDINDSHGHRAGDQVLAHVAGRIAKAVRRSDLVARYGGEEFAVLLTGSDREHGVELAERIRQDLADAPCRVDDVFLPVTVSIGVAETREWVQFGESALDDVLARADKALYAAKAAGRDRVAAEEAD
uniref:diguanylate cyclase n=1 Tax=Desulfovibrio sp. U5L TaxID=596152 RepID=I2PXD3_9BACT